VLLFSEIPYKLTTNTETIKGLGYLLILSIAGTGLALIFFNKLIKVSSPVFASSVTYLIPIVAIIWGVIDGESFHLLYFLCFLLILSGIFLINITPYSNLNISSWFVFRRKRK
jgi:drug/metabolite transporter (DMT)-like permease